MWTRLALVLACWIALLAKVGRADEAADPQRGLELLLTKAYLPPAFDQQTFDEAWQAWEEPLRSQAAAATAGQRRQLAYRRYGFTERRGDPQHRPMQYVVDNDGNWTMNCLACHQGTVAGKVLPGAPNTQFALATLTDDMRSTKLRLGKRLTDVDVGSLMMPLGTTVGTTNAVMFGVALFHYRDADLNIVRQALPPAMSHHDHDAPPWWNTSRKKRLYCDNFAPRGHRALMQFIASKENGPEQFRAWEDDFRHIEAYIDSLEPPRFPYPIDPPLAEQGRAVFEQTCARCHGTYGNTHGNKASYPELIVPIEEVATDEVRLRSLSAEHRAGYARNWINEYGRAGAVITHPGGYLAPPLDGIWASAPYLHNGGVPTLWHLLHPHQRPAVWVRSNVDEYDQQRVGLAVEVHSDLPSDIASAADRRWYFDTRRRGKSAAGHDFPSALSDTEREAVLEFLKTL